MLINAALSTSPMMRVYPRRLNEDATPLRPSNDEGMEAISPVHLQLRADQKDPTQVIDYRNALRNHKRVDATTETEESDSLEKKTEKAGDEEKRGVDGKELPEEKKEEVLELERRDQEVRTHEQAHLSAAGGHARGGINLEYQLGPDGQQYAIGGHVSIDSSEEATPEQTIAKMQTVRRAALAPAQPSSQDMAVAQRASAREQAARQELQKQEVAKAEGEGEGTEHVAAEAGKDEKPSLTKEVDNTSKSDDRHGMNAAAVKRGLQAYKRASGPAIEQTAGHVQMAV
jgi:hypothetical protein